MIGLHDYLAVLQAGGKGTRMKDLTKDLIPKPLLQLGEKSMLEWQIENLHKYGIADFVIITGHLGEQIEETLGNGESLGVRIRYIRETKPLGSGGALFYLKEMLGDARHVLLTLGDVMFDIDVRRFAAFHEKCGGVATLLVHPNGHPHDSDLVEICSEAAEITGPVLESQGGRVTRFDSKTNVRDYLYDNCVNAGLYILEPEIIETLSEVRPLDLEREILLPYISAGRLFAYRTTEYVKDAGTPERFRRAEAELRAGTWTKRNLGNPQRAIFFDRDGTLNIYRGLIDRPEMLDLLPGAAEAVAKVNASEYLGMVVSNQPVVARGMCSVEDVQAINRKLGVLLGKEGAYLDDIAFCPHHPDKGYAGENPLYKIDCSCRKPGAGMLEALAERWNIDLSASWLIGDSIRDIECGNRAGVKTILVRTGEYEAGKAAVPSPKAVADDVLSAVKMILEDKA
ncbi:MAG: HAD-IIIA family hydrolase [Selenomonas ruminantium]|nr:HAD-IIIA family hydrolase [Selenomonas ruminantium]